MLNVSESDRNGGLKWDPARASVELADERALRQAGIELALPVARTALCALSRLICAGEAEQRPAAYNSLLLLREVCALPFERFGETEPASHPELATASIPAGGTAMRSLACEASDLVAYWRVVRNRGDDACLPLEVVLAFAPAPLWPLVATLIGWGPDRTLAHVEEALVVLAQRPTARSNRRRAEGALIAPGTLKNRITSLWKLMECLVELRAACAQAADPALDRLLLGAWTHKPGRPDVFAAGAVDSDVDTSGPPLDECARRLRDLEADFLNAPAHSRYIRERRLVLFALLMLYGIRLAALARLRVEDYLPDHVLRDGIRGPILRIYPRKKRRAGEEYLLPLPHELAAWIEHWIASNGFQIGEKNAPFFPSTRGQRTPLKANGLGAAIAGKANGIGSGCLALLPHAADDPYHGWGAHQYRHTAYRLAQQAGAQAKDEEPVAFAHVTVGDFASATVAHTLANTVRNTYNDLDVHTLLRATATRGWLILRDAGIRRGPDPADVRQARLHLEALQAEQAQITGDLADIEAELDRLHQQTATLDGDLLNRALIQAKAYDAKTGRLNRELGAITTQIERAHQALSDTLAAEHPIPDELSDEDQQQLLAQALGQQAQDPALAATLTVSDLAGILNVGEGAINRWQREGLPAHRAGLWTQEAWEQTTRNNKRLRVDHLNTELLTDPQRRALIRVRRERATIDSRTPPASPKTDQTLD